MRMSERVAEGDGDGHDVAVREPSLLKQSVERLAADQFGDQVGALVVDGGLIEGDDGGMREPRRGPIASRWSAAP